MPHIHAYRPNGSLVAQPTAHAVGEVVKQVLQIHGGVHVAAVIERRSSQRPAYQRHRDPQREAQLRVRYKKHLAAYRHADLLSATRILRWAYQDLALRSRAVQAEAAQRAAAA